MFEKGGLFAGAFVVFLFSLCQKSYRQSWDKNAMKKFSMETSRTNRNVLKLHKRSRLLLFILNGCLIGKN